MSLHIILGPMFSGKTTSLMRELERYQLAGIPVLAINHSFDQQRTERQATLRTHNHQFAEALMLPDLALLHLDAGYRRLYQEAEVVAIDEAQFFRDLLEQVVQMVERDGKTVYVAGLDGTADRKRFGQILDLIPYCDSVVKLTGVCKDCHQKMVDALFTKSLAPVVLEIQVGGAERYKAVCRKHFAAGGVT